MRLIIPLLLVCSTIASPIPAILEARQGRAAILNGLDTIGKSVDSLITEILAWNGQASSLEKVISATDVLKGDIAKATTEIDPTPPVGIIEAITIIWPAKTLDGKVEKVMDTLIDKKGQFVQAGSEIQLRGILKELYYGADGLQKSIVSKMQDIAVPIAEGIAQSFTDKLEAVWEAFGGEGPAPEPAPLAISDAVPVAVPVTVLETNPETVPKAVLEQSWSVAE